jgi:hypothetical protein
MITLRVVGLSVSGGALAERDAVPDGDLLGSDEDVFDEQPQDAAALVDGGGLGVGVQCGEEGLPETPRPCGQASLSVATSEAQTATRVMSLTRSEPPPGRYREWMGRWRWNRYPGTNTRTRHLPDINHGGMAL